MRLANSATGFGWVSILCHWITFLLVAFLLVEGAYMVELTYYDRLYTVLPEWHKLAGLVLTGLTVLRLAWLVYSPAPPVLAVSPLEAVLARGAHRLMYLLIVVLIVTGILVTGADGHPPAVFDTPFFPAFGKLSENTAMFLGGAHQWLAYGLGVLALMHTAAALKHHFLDKDDTLRRMIKPEP